MGARGVGCDYAGCAASVLPIVFGEDTEDIDYLNSPVEQSVLILVVGNDYLISIAGLKGHLRIQFTHNNSPFIAALMPAAGLICDLFAVLAISAQTYASLVRAVRSKEEVLTDQYPAARGANVRVGRCFWGSGFRT